MATSKNRDREAREARIRLRNYQAKKAVHALRLRRRKRDNYLASVGILVVVAVAIVAQLAYFWAKPDAPAEVALPTPSPPSTTAPTTGEVPPSSLAQGRQWAGTLAINGISLGITLDGAAAPQAVSSFVSLSQKGFYSGLGCHRLTTNGFSVLQCGDPSGNGSGGPGYAYGPIENAPSNNVYPVGTIAMARTAGNGNSQGSQFFIVYADTTIPSDSAGGYTVMGTITSGLDELNAQVTSQGTVDGQSDGKPKVSTTIDTVTVS